MEPFDSDVPDQRAWVVLGAFALRECAVGFDSHTLDYFRQKGGERAKQIDWRSQAGV